MPSEPAVVLTRPRGENARLAARLAARGIASHEIPCVEVRPLDDPSPLREALRVLTGDDLLVITSRAGARAVATVLGGGPCAAPVAAIGPGTASACRDAGLRVTFVPSIANGAALAAELPLPRGAILLARSDRAATEPGEILARRGATVGEVVAYRTTAVAPREPVPAGAVVVFASPSAVDGFALSGADLAVAVAIGASTAARVRAALGVAARVAGPDDDEIAGAVAALVREPDAVAGR
ncbi:MAG: uroporphyrinogen-III synthase [Chloroflexota bacterium]|jgi:uroporphyrinogen-III synthase|nr:uroporphyrinogen-III synthase [Chloroflexota bacterium]